MREVILKVSSVFLALLVILNFVLLVTKKITNGLFWIIIVISAIIAYKVLPMLSKNNHLAHTH